MCCGTMPTRTSAAGGLEHDGELVEYEYGSAYLLGKDGALFVGSDLIAVLQPLFVELSDESAGSAPDQDWKPRREALFLWYRRGLGL